METITRPGTPLRHRMLDDMRMRKFAEPTQDGYIRAVRKLAAFLGRSPDTASIEDWRILFERSERSERSELCARP